MDDITTMAAIGVGILAVLVFAFRNKDQKGTSAHSGEPDAEEEEEASSDEGDSEEESEPEQTDWSTCSDCEEPIETCTCADNTPVRELICAIDDDELRHALLYVHDSCDYGTNASLLAYVLYRQNV
jgi:hypothetical protein